MTLTIEEKERRKEQRRIEKWNKTHKIINEIDYKQCSICGEWFHSTEEYFYKNKANSIDGLHPYCKPCAIKQSGQWAKENTEQKREYFAGYYINNKEKFSYDNIDQEKYKEISRRYRQSDKGKQNFKKYRITRLNKSHEISESEWKSCLEYFNDSCAYCGMSNDEHKSLYNQRLHMEHVEHEGSNRLDNCVPSCRNCNSRKHKSSLDEWYTPENSNDFSEYKLIKIKKWLNEDHENFIVNEVSH